MAPGRVSPIMKRLPVVVAVIAIAGAIWYLQRPARGTTSYETAMPPPPRPAPPAGPGASATPGQRIDRVTKLATSEERRQLAERIAAAQTARAALRAPERPRLPDSALTAEPALTKTQIRDAMREVIPHLAACYEAALPSLPEPALQIVAEITLSGDPDVGTLIDSKSIVDAAGTPLPAAFDDCLRTTLMTLALPPLGEGDHITVHYPFSFRPN